MLNDIPQQVWAISLLFACHGSNALATKAYNAFKLVAKLSGQVKLSSSLPNPTDTVTNSMPTIQTLSPSEPTVYEHSVLEYLLPQPDSSAALPNLAPQTISPVLPTCQSPYPPTALDYNTLSCADESTLLLNQLLCDNTTYNSTVCSNTPNNTETTNTEEYILIGDTLLADM
jgi:hypothetical protein